MTIHSGTHPVFVAHMVDQAFRDSHDEDEIFNDLEFWLFTMSGIGSTTLRNYFGIDFHSYVLSWTATSPYDPDDLWPELVFDAVGPLGLSTSSWDNSSGGTKPTNHGYGVWNGISEGALKTLNLWPRFERGASMGKQFVDINATLLRLIDELDTDLWTIDTLFWAMQEIPSDDENTYQHSAIETSLPESERPDQRFGLERHLQEFLRDNWNATSLSNEWDMYSEEGNPDAGYEYPCGIGRIDLLAKHKEKPHWLVIELKKDQTSDETVGQILRYIGWVKEHLAELDEKVFGLIIAHQTDERLRYALDTVPHVQIQLYEVNFQLLPF